MPVKVSPGGNAPEPKRQWLKARGMSLKGNPEIPLPLLVGVSMEPPRLGRREEKDRGQTEEEKTKIKGMGGGQLPPGRVAGVCSQPSGH